MPNQSPPLRDLAQQIADLQRRVRAGSSTPQLGHSSFEDGAIRGYSGEQLVMQIGRQWDGTYTSAVTNGPTPPTPSTPSAIEGTEAATIIWDGLFVDGAVAPMDFLRVDLHIGQVSGFLPDHTNRYGTIISPTGGTLPVSLPYGTYYAKLVCWSQAGVVSASSGELEFDVWPVEVSSDGFAPTASPNPEALAGIDAIYVRWTAITNADPVWYDVHISPSLGFTPDSSTLIGSTRSSMFTIKNLPGAAPPEGEEDTRILAYDTAYYIRIVARDDDGSAPASLQAVGYVFQVTGANLSVDAVTARNIAAGSIIGEHFSATVIYAGTFKTAESGQRVETGIAGIQGYKADGSLMINFPTDPEQTALIDAEIIARGLTVTGGATFRATSYVERDASFVLKTATGAPITAPTMANIRMKRRANTEELTDAQVTGELGTFRLVPNEVSCIEWKSSDGGYWVVHQIRPNGTRAWFFDYDGSAIDYVTGNEGDFFHDYIDWEIWSVIEITTSTPAKNGVYRMARWIPSGGNNTYYLWSPAGLNRYSRQTNQPPVVGTNGVDVFVAEVINGDELNIRYFVPDGNQSSPLVPTTLYQSNAGFSSSRPLSTVYYDAAGFDIGAARYLVGERGFSTNNRLVYTSGSNLGSIHPGGTAVGPNSWTASTKEAESFEAAAANPRCIAWLPEEGQFWTFAGDGYFHQHGTEYWDPSVTTSTIWAQISYYNFDSDYETVPGPMKSMTRERRANVVVYTPGVLDSNAGPTEPQFNRIYAAVKATTPTNSEMWLQETISSAWDWITPVTTTTQNPLTVGTFPNSNPGKVQSDNGQMVISGAGTITFGTKEVGDYLNRISTGYAMHARTVAGSANFVKPSNPPARVHCVRVWGPGGAGGGVVGAASGLSEGGGGGGGGFVEKWYLDSELAASEPYTVGAGGVGVVGGAGGAGSAPTTFKSLIAGAGAGGLAMTSNTTSQAGLRGAGGSASGGELNIIGGDGGNGRTINGVPVFANFGGAAAHGSIVQQTDFSAGAGTNGISPGGGGTGAFGAGPAGTNYAGGNGAAGKILIISFY